jgi:Skp family chaperone for outer membrane proteins
MKLCQASRILLVNVVALLLTGNSSAQAPKSAPDNGTVAASLTELRSEVRELKDVVQQLKQETAASRAEMTRLRQELESERAGLAANPTPTTDQIDVRVGHLEDEQQLLSGKVDEQYQTKVESASKYRVRLSGVVLFNLFSNQGTVDNMDVPTLAYPSGGLQSSGSFGGTLRQSILGLEVFGPQLMNARTSGSVNFDVGGGFPNISNGVNSGLVRLRTATLRFDWKNTDLVVGQDQLFFSPNSPTSFASLIVPALSYSGNLWAWTPQMRVEHRIALSEKSTVTLQAGILDPLTGEPPYYSYAWYRKPQAGELAREPAYAGRIAYSHPLFGHTFTIGTAAYYSRENWGYGRDVNGYAAMADWNLPLDRWFTLSGSFYRGQAIGGLGGGIGRSVLYSGPLIDPNSSVLPLNTVGGWAQLKYRPTSTLEFNAAFGQDNPFASDVRTFTDAESYGDPTLTRNQGVFANVIYCPRSHWSIVA